MYRKRVKEMNRTTNANKQTMRATLKHKEVRKREQKVTRRLRAMRSVRHQEYNLVSI